MKLESSTSTNLNGSGLNICIIHSRFNNSMGNILRENTTKRLIELGVAPGAINIHYVPGALEIPLATQIAINHQKPDAVIALGIVIKGETSHYELVCNESHHGLMQVSLKTNVPVIFGIIAAFTKEQVYDRIEENRMNKGKEYAEAAVEMALFKKRIE